MERFPLELLLSARNLFRHESIAPFVIGTAATGFAALQEDSAKRYFAPTRRFHEFGDTGQAAAGPSVTAAAAGTLFFAGRASRNKRFRAMTYSLAQATALSVGFAAAAKSFVHRERPNRENDRSFYSGHTSNAFAWATVIHRYYGTRASIPAYAFATLVGVSRVEKNAHYLTDVTSGATMGYIVGRAVCRPPRLEDSRVNFGIARSRGGGVVVSVRITLR